MEELQRENMALKGLRLSPWAPTQQCNPEAAAWKSEAKAAPLMGALDGACKVSTLAECVSRLFI